jgi:hypothetical protein
MIPIPLYSLDQTVEGQFLIKEGDNKTYTAGYDKEKAIDLVKRLNDAHRPNVHQAGTNCISVCWNTHEKGQACEYIKEIYIDETI